MRFFGVISAICVLTVFCLGAYGRPAAAQATPSAVCPSTGTAVTDGCSLSNPNATTLYPAFFAGYAAQSGQTHKVRPAWNVAGVDYPVGYYTPLDQLIDVRASQPKGCGLKTYGQSVALSCTGSGALNISGYRFDLHGGTWLIINSASYSSAVINNSYFLNGPVSDRAGGALILVSNLVGDLRVLNTTLDGNGRSMTAGLYYLIEDTRGGAQRDIIEQSAFFRIPQKGIGTGPCGDTFIEQNYFEELELSPSHGEFTIDGTTACVKPNLVEAYNTFLLTSGLSRTGSGGIAAIMFLSGGNALRSWQTIIASHNTMVSNTIGSAAVSPGVGAAITSRIIEEGGGAVYGQMQYLYNFIDATGSLLCYYLPTPTPASTIFRGNTNLLDGSPMNDFSQASCVGHHP